VTMAEEITLPGVGPVKRTQLFALGGVAAGVVAFAWWRRSRDAAAAEAPPEPEDPYEGSFGTNGGGDGSVSGYPDSTSDTKSTAPRTNAEWSQLVMEKLADSYDGVAINGAIGRYLARAPLSPLDLDIIRAAVARAGYPPDGSYPLSPGGTATLAAPAGFTAVGGTASVALRWAPVSGATGYVVYRDGARDSTPTGTSATISGLTPGTTYSWQVSALAANGAESPKSTAVRAGALRFPKPPAITPKPPPVKVPARPRGPVFNKPPNPIILNNVPKPSQPA